MPVAKKRYVELAEATSAGARDKTTQRVFNEIRLLLGATIKVYTTTTATRKRTDEESALIQKSLSDHPNIYNTRKRRKTGIT